MNIDKAKKNFILNKKEQKMKFQQNLILSKINILENYVLVTKKNSPIWIGNKLYELRKLRKDFYQSIGREDEYSSESQSLFIDEFSKFCNFNYKLLTTKLLSNAVFSETLIYFIKDYYSIENFDTDGEAKRLTLEVIQNIKSDLTESKCGMSDYRIREVDLMLKRFGSATNESVNNLDEGK